MNGNNLDDLFDSEESRRIPEEEKEFPNKASLESRDEMIIEKQGPGENGFGEVEMSFEKMGESQYMKPLEPIEEEITMEKNAVDENSPIFELNADGRFTISNKHLSLSEQRQRYAKILYHNKLQGDICVVCLDPNVYEDHDGIVICSLCNCALHQSCYGGELIDINLQEDNVDGWKCHRCSYLTENDLPYNHIKCEFCPEMKGAMKKLREKQIEKGWAHVNCVNWIPEIYFTKLEEKADASIAAYLKKDCCGRKNYTCHYCFIQYGDCLKCDHESDCQMTFHVLCAHLHGIILDWKSMQSIKKDGDDFFVPIYCKEHLEKELPEKFEMSTEIEKINMSQIEDISLLDHTLVHEVIPVKQPEKKKSNKAAAPPATKKEEVSKRLPRVKVENIVEKKAEPAKRVTRQAQSKGEVKAEPATRRLTRLAQTIENLEAVLEQKQNGELSPENNQVEEDHLSYVPRAKKSSDNQRKKENKKEMEREKENKKEEKKENKKKSRIKKLADTSKSSDEESVNGKEDQKEPEEDGIMYKFRPELASIFDFYEWANEKDIKLKIQKYLIKKQLYNRKKETIELDEDVPLKRILGKSIIDRRELFDKIKPFFYIKNSTEENPYAAKYEQELQKHRMEQAMKAQKEKEEKEREEKEKLKKQAHPKILPKNSLELVTPKILSKENKSTSINGKRNGNSTFHEILEDEIPIQKKKKLNNHKTNTLGDEGTTNFLKSVLQERTDSKPPEPEVSEGLGVLNSLMKADHMTFRKKMNWFTVQSNAELDYDSINKVKKILWRRDAEMLF